MTNQEKYEHTKFIIERFDHYNDSVNNKGSFYIALNTFLLGGLFAGFVSLYKDIHYGGYLMCLLLGFGVCSLVSIGLTIIAINPFLNSGTKGSRRKSLMFFGSISEYQKNTYVETFLQQDADQILNDSLTQAWVLSTGLTGKYKKLKIAGWLLIAQFVLMIPIIYYIALNLISK